MPVNAAPRPAPGKRAQVPAKRAPAPAPKRISILFVDGRGQIRSVLAQAKAEITRLWALNKYGHNLFSRLDSAGIRIESSLTKKGNWKLHSSGNRGNRDALGALFGHPQNKEEEDLKHRFMDKYTARGIDYSDFDKFDYILTFDKDLLKDLRALQRVAKDRGGGKSGLRANTQLLSDENSSSTKTIPSPTITPSGARRSDFEPTIRDINNELVNFLRAATGQNCPKSISITGTVRPYRSRQFLAPARRDTNDKVKALKELEKHIKISVDDEVGERKQRVVTVTAKKAEEAELKKAFDLCRDKLGHV